MQYLARVNPLYFAAAEVFIARKDVRYYLNGVCIQHHPKGGVILVGTNGHFMVAIHDPAGWLDPDIKEFIVGGISKRLLNGCQQQPKYVDEHHLWIAANCAVVSTQGQRENVEPPAPFDDTTIVNERIHRIETDEKRNYPDWRRVLGKKRPDKPRADYPAVKAYYLSQVAKAADILNPRGRKRYGTPVRLEPTLGENDLLAIRLSVPELMDRFVAAIMPMRAGPQPATLVPEFAMPLPDPEPAAQEPAPKPKRVRKKAPEPA